MRGKNSRSAANAFHLRFGRAHGGYIPSAGTTAWKKLSNVWRCSLAVSLSRCENRARTEAEVASAQRDSKTRPKPKPPTTSDFVSE